MRTISITTLAGVLLLALSGRATAQDLPAGFDETFALTSLDPLLMLQADAVVRLDLLRFEVQHRGKATETIRHVVTVLNQDGRDAGELYVYYDDRLRHLKKLTGQIRDAQGKVVRKLKKDDQEDYSAISGYSLYEENRVRLARLYHHAYPYTVEFEYEILHDGLINWPTWYPQEDGMPVVFGRFEVVTAADVDVRYQVRGTTLEPVVSQKGNEKTFRWEVAALPPFEMEPFGPVWRDQVIAVHTAPAAFEIEGARGDMRSWQTFGQWYYALGEGRAALPPDARLEVQRRTQGLTDDREKVRRLYEYLQEKTRYVSIQLGLGGWQTFDAAYVHERGYGDCKALTNYMRALLKEAGIPSFPALIRGGTRAPEVLSEFPSNQFNHVVLSVPMRADTVWLECTSQIKPFGHLGSFTEDRYALLVKPGGGELVRTPRSRAHDNRQVRHARVRLDASGDAAAEVHTRYTGNQQDDIRQDLATLSGRERTEWLHDHIDLPSFELASADFSSLDARTMILDLPMTLNLPRYAARTGKRLFLPVNLLQRWSHVPPTVEARTQPVNYFPYAFLDADTIRYTLPQGFAIEAMPEPVEVETAFGRYAAEVAVEPDGALAYYRRLEITQASFPAEEYDAFREFMRQVAQADHAQVVLVVQ